MKRLFELCLYIILLTLLIIGLLLSRIFINTTIGKKCIDKLDSLSIFIFYLREDGLTEAIKEMERTR
jgi:hypothetical protein